jgi:hypothetical protein
MAKASMTGFHRVVHRVRPVPVGSRLRVTRYRHFNAACSGGKCQRLVRPVVDGRLLALGRATRGDPPFLDHRKADGPAITVRVIEYIVHTSPATGGPTTSGAAEESSELFCLVTDLLDPEAYPALDLAGAYPMRWQSETVIGHHKTDMGAGMAVLRSKDPEGVAQEMWALFAVYQAIHTLIGAALDATGIPPEKISFPQALAAATDSVTAGFPPSGS